MTAVADLKRTHRATWAAGDYAAIAELIDEVPPRDLLSIIDITPGQDVLDVAAGTGNVALRAAAAGAQVIGLDLTPELFDTARRRAAEWQVAVDWVEGDAEDLPFDDGSFDTVVATLVFCTVTDPGRAVAEARRVLVEAGSLLFLEHVRGETRQLAWWQDRLERPWGWVAGGCHPNRATDHLLADAGFWIEQLDRDRMPKAPPWVRPMVRGIARRPSVVGSDEPEWTP